MHVSRPVEQLVVTGCCWGRRRGEGREGGRRDTGGMLAGSFPVLTCCSSGGCVSYFCPLCVCVSNAVARRVVCCSVHADMLIVC